MNVQLTGHGVEQFRGDRVAGRRLLPADLDFLADLHADAGVMAQHDGPRSAATTERFVRSNVAHWRRYQFGLYIVSRTEDPEQPIGRAGLRWNHAAGGEPTVDVNCVLVERSWGRGLGTELFRALTAIGLDLGLPLTAGAQAGHVAARRALERAGFVHDGEYERHGHPRARYRWPTDAPTPAELVARVGG